MQLPVASNPISSIAVDYRREPHRQATYCVLRRYHRGKTSGQVGRFDISLPASFAVAYIVVPAKEVEEAVATSMKIRYDVLSEALIELTDRLGFHVTVLESMAALV